MGNFRPIDRETGFLLPPSVEEWLPERDLARFVVEVIDGLDHRAMNGSYRRSGSASYHSRMLLGILVTAMRRACSRAASWSGRRMTTADLMARAEAADAADVPDRMSIPEELARREERLRRIAEARAEIEARAKERYQRELAEHEGKLAARAAKTAATGKTPGGRRHSRRRRSLRRKIRSISPTKTKRITPIAGGGFDQCYNAQALVAVGSMLVVAVDVVQAPGDKQQIEPPLKKLDALPDELGDVENLLADTGYFSEANVDACEKAGVEPAIAWPGT